MNWDTSQVRSFKRLNRVLDWGMWRQNRVAKYWGNLSLHLQPVEKIYDCHVDLKDQPFRNIFSQHPSVLTSHEILRRSLSTTLIIVNDLHANFWGPPSFQFSCPFPSVLRLLSILALYRRLRTQCLRHYFLAAWKWNRSEFTCILGKKWPEPRMWCLW